MSPAKRRKERIDRGIKACTDDIFCVSSMRELAYLVLPRVLPVLLVLLIMFLAPPYWKKVMVITFVMAMMAISWDFLASCGLVSLGQALFFALGAYCAGGLNLYLGLLVILFGREIRKSRSDGGYVSPTSDAALQGSFGQVARRLDPAGEVVVSGEVWEAELLAGGVANVGERVRVAKRRDNCLLVERQPYELEPGQPGEIV